MQLTADGFSDNEWMPVQLAFGVADPASRVRLGQNRNPGLSWSGAPEGTRSLVVVCVDTDVPTRPDDVNQEGRTVPADLPRARFYHWVMVDVPSTVNSIGEGDCSAGITAHGKVSPPGPAGARQGINDFTSWFAGDDDMAGDYYGYDGPCPPWNDSIVHHYHFEIHATDLDRCPVDGAFTGDEVMAAIEGHVLASATVTGLYSLNPDLA